tara:strand:- start:142 stop:348 length:207 start_codon:yes stop_codon:yes gene_type:complete
MSTKITISHSNDQEFDYHFYEECLDEENVWLDIPMKLCGETQSLAIKIPITYWKQMINGWNKSNLAKD